MSRPFLDPNHPMLRPLWVRFLIVAICIGWALFEFVTGSFAWAMIFWAAGGYALWVFWVRPPPDGDDAS